MKTTAFFVGILTVLAAWPVAARQKDPNRAGFRLYQRGKFKEAFKLFEKAVQQTPGNPYGWLNHARTNYVLSRRTEPEDVCSQEENWVFSVLASLSRAVELDRKAVLEKLAPGDENFDGFKKHPEFIKWRASVSGLPVDDAALSKFLIAHPDWEPYQNDFPPVSYRFTNEGKVMTLSPDGEKLLGNWSVKKTTVSIQAPAGRVLEMKLASRKLYFDQGRKWYFKLQLEGNRGADTWTLGPRFGDCGETNF